MRIKIGSEGKYIAIQTFLFTCSLSFSASSMSSMIRLLYEDNRSNLRRIWFVVNNVYFRNRLDPLT